MKKFIKLASVISMTGLSKSSIYAMMKKGEFPKSVTIGSRAVAWVEAEIQKWIEEKISFSRVA
jgi:prophage regulatory protein